MIGWPTDEEPVAADPTAYRVEAPGPSVRLAGIEETPIGQETLFADLEAGAPSALLTSRFVVPPFSVLDARAGYWQSRKAQWLALGMQSELGRDVAAIVNTMAEAKYPYFAGRGSSDASIFDPVLCELAYRWFSRVGDTVLDPFAGGSVRGIVAAILGHPYTGIDLSGIQLVANRQQAEAILAADAPQPVWLEGDAADLDSLVSEQYDLVFSCPPYFDLEVYSSDPADLSAMPSYDAFLEAYRRIIRLAIHRLKPERFAVWVVGDVRSKDGWQRGLVADTIQAFTAAGAHLYNEAIMVTPVGTVMLRAPKQFVATRVLGRSHQSVLVFYKGNQRPRWGEQ